MPSLIDTPRVDVETTARPWLANYPKCVPAHLEYPEGPTSRFVERAAEQFPDRVACKYFDLELTYAQMLEQSRRTASALAKLGVKPGDRVGLLLPNMPAYLTSLYGVWMAGASVVSLSPLMVSEEISGLIESTECKVVIALDLLALLVYDAAHQPEHLLLTTIKDRLPLWKRIGYEVMRMQRMGFRSRPEGMQVYSLGDAVAAGDPQFKGPDVSSDMPAYILPTGGTTGHPKAVVLSHKNLTANAWQLYHWGGSRIGREKFLAVLPFFHSYGLSTCATCGAALAATLVLHHKFEPVTTLELIESEKPTIFHAVPRVLTVLNQHLKQKKYDLSSLMFVISGGAALDRETQEAFAQASGARVVEGYGLSEASPVTHTGPLDRDAIPGSIGLPLPDTDARIVDAETGTRELPHGEVGELIVRGPQVMLGYWKDPEETAKAIRDGWLFTGDLATCDDQGFFRIVDRKKDLIITSGFNVYPGDVEQVLKGYPGVVEAAVVGVKDAERGEIVKATLVLSKPGSFKRAEFDKYTAEHLSKHKRPRIVEVLGSDLPRNFLGKVLRRKLREEPAEPEQAS